MYVYIYIYIYISLSLYIYIYIYIYTYNGCSNTMTSIMWAARRSPMRARSYNAV